MQFIERVTGMFTKPEETIKDILKEPRIEEPLVIIGVYGIIAVISSVLSSLHIGSSLSIVSVVFSIILAFVGWIIATGVVHALALFLGGEGKYNPQMLNAIGYTYVVKYIPAIIGLVLIFFMPAYSLPSQPNFSSSMTSDQIKEAMQPYLQLMSTALFNPIAILSMIIGYLGLIWSCFLGSIAVKNGDKVGKTASYIAVFLPMILFIVLSLALEYGMYFVLNAMYG